MKLCISNVSYSYGEKEILKNIQMEIEAGQMTGIIGPNGSGKSTLLKNLYRALKPGSGRITWNGQDIHAMSARQAALKIGVVGQENEVSFDFTVWEIVAMGRNPYKRWFELDSKEDRRAVNDALEQLHIADLAQRSYLKLSGGEKQRVLLARAIAQKTELLVLDEPTNHLDIGCQLEIFQLVKKLGVTVLTAVHDLNLAALYCDMLYVLKEGRIFAQGTPEEVLTPDMLLQVFGVKADIRKHPATKKLAITFLPEKRGSAPYQTAETAPEVSGVKTILQTVPVYHQGGRI